MLVAVSVLVVFVTWIRASALRHGTVSPRITEVIVVRADRLAVWIRMSAKYSRSDWIMLVVATLAIVAALFIAFRS